ncbi:MAG: Phage major tail protein 2 [Clostridiaceae bacterium]|jgi:predicted secreted protein|nr:Phage major tail protein 2 [Clostridiaceae bacterium]
MAIKTGRNGNIKIRIDTTSATAWTTGTAYTVGALVTNTAKTYYCKTAHTAGATFDATEQLNFIEITDGMVVQKMSSWKLTIKQKLVDTNHFGDSGWDSSVPGTKAWDGSIDGSFNVTDDPGQKLIQSAVDSGAEIGLDLYVDENVTTEKYSGNAYIEEISVDTAPKDLVKLGIKFKGNGALTMPQ